jgi:hypothetical protein
MRGEFQMSDNVAGVARRHQTADNRQQNVAWRKPIVSIILS